MMIIKLEREDLETIYDLKDFEHRFNEFIFDEYKIVRRISEKTILKVRRLGDGCYDVNYRIITGCEYRDLKFKVKKDDDMKLSILSIDEKSSLFDTIENNEGRDKASEIIAKTIRLEMLFIDKFEQYIMNESFKRKVIHKEAVVRSSNGSSVKRERKNVKTSNIALLNDIIEYASGTGRSHNISCEVWPVRGHFRRYNNGNVVWIKPYEKGPQRNKSIETKRTYVI